RKKDSPKKSPPKKEQPANPNLEHLRKEAKALLHSFKQREPQALAAFRALNLKATPKLSDAQHLVAREYGFESWPMLRKDIDAEAAAMKEAVRLARKAFHDDDVAGFRRALQQHPALQARVNDPIGDFGSPLINHVRSQAMLDALLDAGADINARSKW